jgi:hypothetical protein
LNSIWNKNLELFSSRFPFLFDLYKKDIEKISSTFNNTSENTFNLLFPFWNIYKAKDNNYTADEIVKKNLQDTKIRLHSAYNPKNEAIQATKNNQINGKTNIIFYGFGIGYQAIEFAEVFSDKKLILIEPDLNHFFASMALISWEKIFKHENLILAISCPPESILQLIENPNRVNIGDEGVSDSFYFDNNNFQIHNMDYFNTIKTIIKRNIKKNDINAATLKKFGKLWTKNSLTNLNEMKKRDFVSIYENSKIVIDNDLPFLILAAGPSLQDILPYLSELKNRMIIICVETAYPILAKIDFEPDFIILTDPQFWAYNHINGLKAPSSILITEISVYPSVFNFNCKKIVLFSSNFSIGEFVETKIKENYNQNFSIGNLGTGGSVASSAWNFACFCGCKSIYTAGLDLSFPEKLTHIKGSRSEQNFHSTSTKLTSIDKMNTNILFSANTEFATDYDNNKVLTDTRMKMFAWWFESKIAANNKIKTFSLCSKSMKINGIQKSNITELLQKKEIITEKEEFLNSKSLLKMDEFAAHFDKITSDFHNDKSEFIRTYPFLQNYLS